MKSSSVFLIVITVWIFTNFGCKSNPTTPTSDTKPEVTIIPDSLHGVEYIEYTFKAKISNYDLAQTYFLWDMGDGWPIHREDLSYLKRQSYYIPGTYTIKVNAYDIYTDSIIATTSENITIEAVHPTVEIEPQFYNGVLKMDDFGNLSEGFSLSAKLSNYNSNSRYVWDFGDGIKDSISGSNIFHNFSQPGIYHVKVDVYQYNGIFDCTDTAMIAINYTKVSLASLRQMGKVQAVLYLDSSYPVMAVSGFRNPLAIGLLFSNSSGYTSSWDGGNFSSHFHAETGSGTTNYELKDFLVSGSLSSDNKTVSSIDVSVEDTTAVGKVNTIAKYSFKAENAKLLAASEEQIIYKVSAADLKNLLHVLSFSSYWKDNSDCGVYPAFLQISANTHPEAQLLIVFSKQ